jgi:uncharacterized membrane protein YhaH (DUF805 family)
MRSLFSPRGRIDRRAYWIVFAGLALSVIVLAVIGALSDADDSGRYDIAYMAAFALILALNVAITTTTGIKRLHDQDLSGWWLLVAFVPFVGWALAVGFLGFRPGTAGANRFGAGPR